MQSLNNLSFATLFEYLANKPLDDNIKKLFTKYLTENKSIVDDYLSKKPVYGVYYRGEDTYVNNKYDKIFGFVKIFGTLDAAYEWVIKNGKEVVDEHEDNYDRPIVLTIIETDPNDTSGHISDMFLVSANQYPTFAFSDKAYNMLLDEHLAIFQGDWCREPVNNWIYFVSNNGLVTRGCSWEHINKLLELYLPEYKENATKDALTKFELLNEN